MLVKYKKGFYISLKISKIYEDFISLSLDEEEKDGINEKIIELKELIERENFAYKQLSLNEIIYYYNANKIESNKENIYINRYLNKLERCLNVKSKKKDLTSDGYFLAEVIESMLIINTLKKINKIVKDNIDNEEIKVIKFFLDISKYSYLSYNPLIEKIAIEHNFDIDSLSNITDTYDSFLRKNKEAMSVTLMFVLERLMFSLINEENNDNIFGNLYQMEMFTLILNLLDKKQLNLVIHKFNNLYKANDSSKTIRKLLKKKKEELKSST